MFTGLVAGVGRVVATASTGDQIELSVDLGQLGRGDSIGDSIALSGVCCTVTRIEHTTRWFVLTAETIRRTWLAEARPGRILNIEKPLRVGDPLGGHVVQGHVDGIGTVMQAVAADAGGELWVQLPAALSKYCVAKGSIALDGISLTIASLEDHGSDGSRIMVTVIPHTAKVTSIGTMTAGQPIHVEVDVLAKYVERLMAARC